MSIVRNHGLYLSGAIEDITCSIIEHPLNILRSRNHGIQELAESIGKLGLLHPIVVRAIAENKFEIVAGNRRYDACKLLGFRKISCHVVELDDKGAFEVSLIENLQRHTLNPLEEALAFEKYINDFGWGGETDLARKICKSPKYVCRRLKLLELPKNILDLISDSKIYVSTAEEVLAVKDKQCQSLLGARIKKAKLSSKQVRLLVSMEMEEFNYTVEKQSLILKSFDKSIIALRMALSRLAIIIDNVEPNWIFYEILMQHKNMLHAQIDLMIRQKRKSRRMSMFKE